MNLRNIITFTILLLFVSAIGLLFFPSKMLAVVGITGNDELDFLLRTTGAGVASLIPGAWAVRSAVASPVSRVVLDHTGNRDFSAHAQRNRNALITNEGRSTKAKPKP